MDFEKIKSAAEEIKLSDSEKQKLIDMCEASKPQKKKNRYVPAIVVAAAALVLVIFSPGFLFRAKMADHAPMENAAADYEMLADKYEEDGIGNVILQSSSTVLEYRKIYYEIPIEFSSLVSEAEFAEWKNRANNSHGMPMMNFIRAFEISREDFERANADYAQRIYDELGMAPLLRAADCAEQEQAEIFNADIIFSFNESRIESYYSVPDYEFSSMSEFVYAVKNGYVSLSEQAPGDFLQ